MTPRFRLTAVQLLGEGDWLMEFSISVTTENKDMYGVHRDPVVYRLGETACLHALPAPPRETPTAYPRGCSGAAPNAPARSRVGT